MLHLPILKKEKTVSQCKGAFKEMILRVPQGSIVGPILFNIFFNDFFYFILVASAHDFADDNTLSSVAKIIENLISILESEREAAINWFKNNHMIVIPGKFRGMIYDKHKENHTNQIINIDQKEIKVVSKVKILGIELMTN